MKRVICYTDGSCRPQPGISGYGIHMYFTDDEDKTKPRNLQTHWGSTATGYKLKTDIKREKIPEVGIVKILDVYGFNKQSFTNNTAELDAVIECLNMITDPISRDLFDGVEEIYLLADSNYVLQSIKNILTNKDYKPEANARNIAELKKALIGIKALDIKLTYKHVKAHNGELGNEKADLLSNMGRKLNSNMKDDKIRKYIVTNASDYYSSYTPRQGEFTNKFLFNYNLQDKEKVAKHNYHMLSYSTEHDIGKRMNSSVYINLFSNTPNKEIDNIISLMNNELGDDIRPYVVYLDTVYNKIILKNIELYGNDYIRIENKIFPIVYTMDDHKLAAVLYPEGIAYMSQDIIDLNVRFIEDYLSNQSPNIKSINITDLFLTKDKKDKNMLLPDIKNDKDKIVIDISETIEFKHKVKLHLGLDIAKRNILKKLEKDIVNIKLLIEDYKTYFKYSTIIELNRDDEISYLHTDNHYSNTIYNIKHKKKE